VSAETPARILVIDDDKFVRDVVERVLQAEGYDVTVVADGSHVRELADFGFDLVITDMLMPGDDGVQTIMFFRKQPHPPKIIAISGGGLLDADRHLELAQGLGAMATLRKPFSPEELVGIVREILGG
jgi:CheY-like chemotaxis protein